MNAESPNITKWLLNPLEVHSETAPGLGILLIVLGVLAIIALFVASALLPPMLLAVALMGLVVLGFVAVAIFWHGD